MVERFEGNKVANPNSAGNMFTGIQWQEGVTDGFPRPLAYTYARLIDEVDKGEPVAATWALRDAWECAVRFVACVGMADLVQAGAQGDELEKALSLLFKPTGVSLGDWAGLLAAGCNGAITTTRPRLLPGLTGFYRKPGGKVFSAVGQALSRSDGGSGRKSDDRSANVVQWRNRVLGHGVFRQERLWYAKQTMAWQPPLNGFYAALAPIFKDWTLRDGGPEGPRLIGAGTGLAAGAHEHVAAAGTEEVVLAGPQGACLRFGPLLSAQRCQVCSERHVFFYDNSKRKKAGPDGLRTEVIDYLRGHQNGPRPGWPAALAWEELLPKNVRWQRTAFDQEEVVEGERLVFRSFETEYKRPDWIIDRLWKAIEEVDTGYVHLEGPGGVGKSYIARALKAEAGEERGIPVLLHHIFSGSRTDHRVFITLLGDEAKEQLNWRTQEVQAKDQSAAALAEEFREFLGTLMTANQAVQLIVVLDGLDELPARESGEFALADFLPPASNLPKGCVVVLTGRRELRPGIAERIAHIRALSGEKQFRVLALDAAERKNRDLLAHYALERLPEPLRRTDLAERVVEKAGGRFLYVFHLVQALAAGAFTEADELPTADRFYPAYLARLRERVGDVLYEEVYRSLLLFLVAARAPITFDQLAGWGLRREHLRTALYDISDFIEELRVSPRHEGVDDMDTRSRYRIAHLEFVAFVEGDAALASLLTQAHGRIATVIRNRHPGGWDTVKLGSDEDSYDIGFAVAHETLAGHGAEAAALLCDINYQINRLENLAPKGGDGGIRDDWFRINLAGTKLTWDQSDWLRFLDDRRLPI